MFNRSSRYILQSEYQAIQRLLVTSENYQYFRRELLKNYSAGDEESSLSRQIEAARSFDEILEITKRYDCNYTNDILKPIENFFFSNFVYFFSFVAAHKHANEIYYALTFNEEIKEARENYYGNYGYTVKSLKID